MRPTVEMRFPRPSVLSVAMLLLLLPSRPSRGRPLGVRRGAHDSGDEEEEHRKMSKAMVRKTAVESVYCETLGSAFIT